MECIQFGAFPYTQCQSVIFMTTQAQSTLHLENYTDGNRFYISYD